MGIFSRMFKADPKSVYTTCFEIYNKAKTMRPGKPERDYLKLVLITKPPFDCQTDMLINGLLDEYDTIHDLSKFVAATAQPHNRDFRNQAFRSREDNLKNRSFIKERNKLFFEEFWA